MSSKVQITISEKDKELLKWSGIGSLRNRFSDSGTSDYPVFLAIERILTQIVTEEELDNYDYDGTCPKCSPPEIEDVDYMF